MNETNEMWREYRAAWRTKRSKNLSWSTAELERRAIPFESKNGGVHLIVMSDGAPWADFWPSTGKWIERPRADNPIPAPKRGVKQLIEHYESAQKGARRG